MFSLRLKFLSPPLFCNRAILSRVWIHLLIQCNRSLVSVTRAFQSMSQRNLCHIKLPDRTLDGRSFVFFLGVLLKDIDLFRVFFLNGFVAAILNPYIYIYIINYQQIRQILLFFFVFKLERKVGEENMRFFTGV